MPSAGHEALVQLPGWRRQGELSVKVCVCLCVCHRSVRRANLSLTGIPHRKGSLYVHFFMGCLVNQEFPPKIPISLNPQRFIQVSSPGYLKRWGNCSGEVMQGTC